MCRFLCVKMQIVLVYWSYMDTRGINIMNTEKQKFIPSEVYKVISQGLSDFYTLARANVRRHWRGLTREQQYAAARALVQLNDVSLSPIKYFSRVATQADWIDRGQRYAAENDLKDADSAFYFVQDPKGLVLNATRAAFVNNYDLGQLFFYYCDAIQGWEYNRTGGAAEKSSSNWDASRIYDLANRVSKKVQAQKPNPIVAMFGRKKKLQR